MSSHDQPSADSPKLPGLPPVDVNEYGGKRDGVRQSMNRRLFMQLLVFDVPGERDTDAVAREVAGHFQSRKVPCVVYADANAPRGFGLLTWSEDPSKFVTDVRPVFANALLRGATLRPEFTMLGRTYSGGHEPDLEHVLLRRPIDNVCNEQYRWHVWYPLRRIGAFAKLDPQEQGAIMREHAAIGMAYGQKELAHDVRLACHGLDTNDNEFVIGLVGSELHPLSHLVQSMRKTRQTSEFIEKMGPFFVGYVLARHPG
jgi:chlorite dismutase